MRKTLLIIGYVWPEPKSSAAGSRMMQLIHAFKAQNFQVTFATPCARNENAFDLPSIGIQTANIQLNDPSFDDFVKDLEPDIVLFDRYMMEEQFGWRVAEHCPGTLRILDTEDLHCLRKGRHNALKDQVEFNTDYLFNDLAKREIASMYRCDLSLIISEFEMELLQNFFKVTPQLLHYLPFMFESLSANEIENLTDFEDRDHFVCVGNYLHEPNLDSLVFLKESIWPLIRAEFSEAQLHSYGAYESQKVKHLHDRNSGFLIKGFVEDIDHILKSAKICLAPLRFGAGLKGKIFDAMRNGTPCIMTSVAAEGILDLKDWKGCITDDIETFAMEAIALFKDNDLWSSKQKEGIHVLSKFDESEFKIALFSKIDNILTNLKDHRSKNFTGQMLMHHSLQSTKYLSKYIEMKQKK